MGRIGDSGGKKFREQNKSYKDHFFSSLLRTVDRADSIKLKTNAQRKLSILIPETNLSASIIIITLTTKRKSPNVIIVRGRVKITSKGLTIKLRMANTNAKTTAVVKELMDTCGANNLVRRYTTAAVISTFMINLIIVF